MRPDIQKIRREARLLAKDAKKIADELEEDDKPLSNIKHSVAILMKEYSRLWVELNKEDNDGYKRIY